MLSMILFQPSSGAKPEGDAIFSGDFPVSSFRALEACWARRK